MASNTNAETEFAIAEGGGVKLLERRIFKGEEEYIFYDIMISNTVIVKDCKVVEGKNGYFISTPAREQGGKWYPLTYISNAVQTAALKLIDDDNAWSKTTETFLAFEKPNNSEKDGRNSKQRGRFAR